MLSILTQFLSNRPQPVMADCCRSKLANALSGELQSNVLGPLLFLLYNVLPTMTTFLSLVPSPDVRVSVAESMNRDLKKVNEWCDVWGMKLNESKT